MFWKGFLSKDGGPRDHGEGVQPPGAFVTSFACTTPAPVVRPPVPGHLGGQREDEMEKFTFGMTRSWLPAPLPRELGFTLGRG